MHLRNDGSADQVDAPQEAARWIRWYSTLESTAHGQVTVLALCETAIASLAACWYAWHSGTTTHLVVASLLTPIMLLKTPYSSVRAVHILDSALKRIEPDLDPDDVFDPERWNAALVGRLLLSIPYRMVIPLVASVARIVGICRSGAIEPLWTVGHVPANWYRVVLAQDLAHPPELVADAVTLRKVVRTDAIVYLSMSDWIAAINYLIVRYQKQFESPLALSVIWLLVAAEAAVSLLWIFLPTLLYRFSIKSTALIYLPFLLVIQSGTRRNVGFRHWLTEIQRSALETWRRLYAMATVFIFLVLPVWVLLFAHEVWMQLLDSRRSPMVAVVADLLFVVAGDTVTVHAWHVARIVSAAITMWLWWYASRVLVRLDFESVNTDRSEKLISGALVARGLLGLFTIASTLIILSRAASWLSMPSIRIDWWP